MSTVPSGQYSVALMLMNGDLISRVPVQERARHSGPSGPAFLTVIRSVRVSVAAIVAEKLILAVVLPVYTAPCRASVIRNFLILKPGGANMPDTSTAHGPAVQRGVKSHESVQRWPVRRFSIVSLATIF